MQQFPFSPALRRNAFFFLLTTDWIADNAEATAFTARVVNTSTRLYGPDRIEVAAFIEGFTHVIWVDVDQLFSTSRSISDYAKAKGFTLKPPTTGVISSYNEPLSFEVKPVEYDDDDFEGDDLDDDRSMGHYEMEGPDPFYGDI